MHKEERSIILNSIPVIEIRDQSLPQTSQISFLGVIIDGKLSVADCLFSQNDKKTFKIPTKRSIKCLFFSLVAANAYSNFKILNKDQIYKYFCLIRVFDYYIIRVFDYYLGIGIHFIDKISELEAKHVYITRFVANHILVHVPLSTKKSNLIGRFKTF